MSPSTPRIFIDNRSQPFREFMESSLPQGSKGTSRGDNRIIVDTIARGNLCDLIGHSCATGDTMNERGDFIQDPAKDVFNSCHLPENIHVETSASPRCFMGYLSLGYASLDGIVDQLVMTFPTGLTFINKGNGIAIRI